MGFFFRMAWFRNSDGKRINPPLFWIVGLVDMDASKAHIGEVNTVGETQDLGLSICKIKARRVEVAAKVKEKGVIEAREPLMPSKI